MATRVPSTDGSTTLPPVVPFDLSPLTRLSSDLGARVVDGEEAVRESRWEHAETAWRLSVVRVTGETVVLSVRTPVGRRRFYGATRADAERVRPALEAASAWRRLD